jgi:hypothetical protein
MVFDPHDAEELTQEVLVKVITKLSTFKGESKFRTWRTGLPGTSSLPADRLTCNSL